MFTLSNAFYPYIGGPGLSVSIDAGFLFNSSGGGATLIPSQTISLAANSTTYVFMNLSAVAIQSNTSGSGW